MSTSATDAAVKDRARLTALLRALDASDTALRREQCRSAEPGDYAITGSHGHVYPDGDGFLLYVSTDESPRRWTSIKRRLGFCRLKNDGDDEGAFYLDRLPTGAEADAVRDAVGIKRKRRLSPEAKEALRSRLASRHSPQAAPLAA